MDLNHLNLDPHLAYLLPLGFVFGLVMAGLVLIPLWRICAKAGFSPLLSLIIFIPLGAPILLYILAFVRWPAVPAPPAGAGYPYPPPTIYPPQQQPPPSPPARY